MSNKMAIKTDMAEYIRDNHIHTLRISCTQDVIEPMTMLVAVVEVDTEHSAVVVEFDGDAYDHIPTWMLQCARGDLPYVIEIVKDEVIGKLIEYDDYETELEEAAA